MLSLQKIFLFAFAATSVTAVTYQDVKNDLITVDQTTKDLGSLADNYSGTSQQTLAINNKVSVLKSQLTTAKSDTTAASAPTESQAQEIIDYINNTLYPDTVSTLSKTKAKRPQFTTAGVKNTIKQHLTDIKALVDALATELINRAPTPAQASTGTALKNQFDSAFDDAIAYFS